MSCWERVHIIRENWKDAKFPHYGVGQRFFMKQQGQNVHSIRLISQFFPQLWAKKQSDVALSHRVLFILISGPKPREDADLNFNSDEFSWLKKYKYKSTSWI